MKKIDTMRHEFQNGETENGQPHERGGTDYLHENAWDGYVDDQYYPVSIS